MALFDMIRERFRAIGRSDDDDAVDTNAQGTAADTRTESLSRPPGPVRAMSESIARGLRGDSGGKTPSWFDGPERRQLRVSETADWTGRTTSAQRNGGFAGSSLLDGNYLNTRVLGVPDTREASVLGPADGNPGGGLFGNDAGATAQGDRGLTGSDLFGAGNDRDDSGRLF
jgi:hypothetical protein